MRTFDGRLVLIPNATLHSEVVTVQTGFEQVRTSVRLDVDACNDLRQVCRIAEEAMRAALMVMDEPRPRALLTSVGAGNVIIELRFWSGATQLETREATHEVISDVLAAFDANDIVTYSDVVVLEPGSRLEEVLRRDQILRPDSPG